MSWYRTTVESVCVLLLAVSSIVGWESKLFSATGEGYTRRTVERDGVAFVLPDFSWAGYRSGIAAIPHVAAADTILPKPGDNAPCINRAIRRLARTKPDSSGFRGKIVLGKGTFEIHGQIRLFHSGIVLAGLGPDKTRIYVNSTDFARKNAIWIQGPDSDLWLTVADGEKRHMLAEAAPDQARWIRLADAHPFTAKDTLIVRQWPTRAFANQHAANGVNIWPVSNDNTAPKFCRVVKRTNGDTLFFEEPLRYPLSPEHGAHVFRARFLTNVGVENLAIGFVKGPDSENNGRTHRATAIYMSNVANGWVRNVVSYKRDDNSVHLQSYGFTFRACKWLTIENCMLQNPQNKNVGGNGYLFDPVCSDDLLFKNCTARNGRHNFTIHYSTSGCVFTGCKSENSRSDFHQYLAVENLFDNFTIQGDSVTAGNRGDKSQGSWWCAAKPVFWNMKGNGAMYCNAWGTGYLIGAAPGISVGTGATGILQDYGLRYQPHRQWIERNPGVPQPASLYKAQLKQRRAQAAEEAQRATADTGALRSR